VFKRSLSHAYQIYYLSGPIKDVLSGPIKVTVVYRFVCVLLIGPHLRDKRDESIDNRNLDLFFSCSAAGIRPKGSLKAGESKAADKEEI